MSSSESSSDDKAQDALKRMRDHPNDADVQRESCMALRCMVEAGILSRGETVLAIEAAATLLNDFLSDRKLQHAAIIFLTKAVGFEGQDMEMLEQVVKKGCIRSVLRSMQLHASDMNIHAVGCAFLQIFTWDFARVYIKELWRERALDAVTETMFLSLRPQSHHVHGTMFIENVQMFCYVIISGMHAPGLEPSLAKPLGNTPNAILNTMCSHVQSAPLLNGAMNTISAVLSYNQTDVNVLLSQPCVKLVLDVINAHGNEHELQISCTSVLSAMAKSTECRAHIAAHNGMQTIMSIIKKEPKDSQILRGALEVLSLMMGRPEDREQRNVFDENGGVDAIVRCMNIHADDETLQKYACGPLTFFLHFSQEDRRMQVSPYKGMVTAVLSAMRCHRRAAGLQTIACMILALNMERWVHFSSSDRYWLQEQVTPSVLESMCAHFADEKVQHHGVDCLYFFTLDKSPFAELVHKHGGIKTLATSLRMHKDNPAMALSICRVLAVAALGSPGNQEQCGEFGIMDLLLELVDRHRDDANLMSLVRVTLDSMTRLHCQNRAYLLQTMTASQAKKLKNSSDGFAQVFEQQARERNSEQVLGRCVDEEAMDKCFRFFRSLKATDTASTILAERAKKKQLEACESCGRTAGELKVAALLRCSACTIAPRYCSAACQRAGWPAHKPLCKLNSKMCQNKDS
jgi:hypothetical protein